MSTSSFNPGCDWLAGFAILVAGFATLVVSDPVQAKKVRENAFAPSYPTEMATKPANGSIFQPDMGYAPLTSGAQAASVGDILTIVLNERTQASKSNAAKANRKGDISLTPPTTGPLSKILDPSDIGASGNNTFDGKGEATQSNQLNGEITVTIAKVFPNGNLLVRGEKQVTLNRGDEFIRISGIIRPADITADNRVSSTRVADARITYSGKGELARASNQGWLQRFFTRFSPF